ncbi:hypothetical protein B9Z19DRAFT_1061417 [Tuber borchii]|uniref:Uncharacterized protein n=1 Tax=Tuber borchii TaxID=42251 RepID=A0A2T7A542_TUBBO|nr:hypothetical protein B9Z19DRAFT_1061417 [Tuber borchii]
MPGISYGDEDCLYFSGETLSDPSQQKGGDRLSHSSELSPTVTSSADESLSDGSSGAALSRGYRRRARRKAAAEAGKSNAPIRDFNVSLPTDAVAEQAIASSGSFDLQDDILLLPGFSPVTVCQMDSENGHRESSQVDHPCWEPADIVECKYPALIPARSPASKFPTLGNASEVVIPSSNLLGRGPELGLGDSFDSLDDVCNITPLQPTRLAAHATPILGSSAQEKADHVLKTSSIEFSLTDPEESEVGVFIRALGSGIIDSAARPLNSSDSEEASPEATKEAQRIAKNKQIFGWVDGVISSASYIPESISTTSSSALTPSATEDSPDLLNSDLLISGSSPNNSASVSSRQLQTRSPDQISLLDLDYIGVSVSPGFSHCTMSSISPSSAGELLLLDFGDEIQDPTPAKDAGLPLPDPQEMRPTPASAPPAPVSINTIPALVEDESSGSTSKELQRKPTVVNVIVSAPKGAKEVSSPILRPIISAAGGSNCEVGNAAWSRWVEENSEPAPGASFSQSAQRQSQRSQNIRKWSSPAPKKGRGIIYPKISLRPMGVPNGGSTAIREPKDKENGSSERNNYARFGSPGVSLSKGRMRPSTPNIAPVTWAGSGLPFEGLAFRPVALGYYTPQTVSYKRTSTFNREQKVREQIYGKHPLPPRPKPIRTFPTKQDVWANQEADFMRCSGP